MKKSFKAICSFAVMLVLLLAFASAGFAADSEITFKGFSEGFDFQPGSEYTDTDLFEGLKNVMPGDTLTETVTFTNTADDCDFINLYMRAEVHDAEKNPLSEKVEESGETVVTMSDFLSKLSMKVWNGTELIYEGSPNDADGLVNNRLLGTFRKGDTATLTVELEVPTTLGNEYANRVGEVDWVFYVDAYNESQLTVRKVWSDGNANHPGEGVTVNLLKDGDVAETQILNEENGWAYTFDRLVEGHTWTVEEAEVAEGYTVSYDTVGNLTTITNTKEIVPGDPLDLTVKKVWSNDDAAKRPDSVTVTLYNGADEYETIVLNAENNWTYHWEDSSVYGNWQIIEKNIPSGYTPSYTASNGTVTITNTRKLIQTGQMNWPILALGVAGVLLIACGAVIMLRKKKNNNA